jgi:hypothetical protein
MGDWITNLQTASDKKVCKLLIPGGRFGGWRPTHRCFWKRVCKRLKTKDGSSKKSGKRDKEFVNI